MLKKRYDGDFLSMLMALQWRPGNMAASHTIIASRGAGALSQCAIRLCDRPRMSA